MPAMYSEEQKAIINHNSGHAMVLAGPGTGKTTTMVGRISRLIESGVNPRDMLILMFNRSAKDDFALKLKKSITGVANTPEVRTYHGLAKSILEALEYKGLVDKRTLETSEKYRGMMALDIIKKTIGNNSFNKIQKEHDKIVEEFISYMDLTKACLLSPKDSFDIHVDDDELLYFIDCYEKFEELRGKKRIRFFPDLISDLAQIITKNDYVAKWLSNKKSHIIVDEYQDTNLSQQLILKTIAGIKASVMVVGDVDQAIYEWRGGTPDLMLNQFEIDFAGSVRYKLSTTYRFGQKLSDSANRLISNNSERFDVKCVSDASNPKTKISILRNKKSGLAVAEKIIELKQVDHKLNDIAILVRLYSAGLPVELELISKGVPVVIDNGYSCFLSKEYKNLFFLLSLSSGNLISDAETNKDCIKNILKFPHVGLPASIIDDIADNAAKNTLLKLPSTLMAYVPRLQIPFQKHKLKERAKALQIVIDMGKTGSKANQILNTYQRETNLFESLKKLSLKETEATESIDRCSAIIEFIDKSHSPAQAISRLLALDENRISLSQESDKVRITTIHKSKGLEYKTVIMTGLEDGRFPYEKSSASGTHINEESERRLFFVGVTRAIENLFLDVPLSYQDDLNTGPENSKINVSRFIAEFI